MSQWFGFSTPLISWYQHLCYPISSWGLITSGVYLYFLWYTFVCLQLQSVYTVKGHGKWWKTYYVAVSRKSCTIQVCNWVGVIPHYRTSWSGVGWGGGGVCVCVCVCVCGGGGGGDSHHKHKMVWRPSYLYDINPCAWKYGLYIQMGPTSFDRI